MQARFSFLTLPPAPSSGFLRVARYPSEIYGYAPRGIAGIRCSPRCTIEECVECFNFAAHRDNHVKTCDRRSPLSEAEAPCHPSYPVMGVGSTQLAKNEIRKLLQEVFDRIVDGFESEVLAIGVDEHTF